MFQFKKNDSGVKDTDNSNALPNTFGQVRTLKKDLENVGKKDVSDEVSMPASPPPAQNIPDTSPKETAVVHQEPKSKAGPKENIPNAQNNPFQSVPTPPPLSQQENAPIPTKSSASQSFFGNTPGHPESKIPESAETPPTTKRSMGKMFLFAIIVIIIIAGGGGFAYYWFFMKSSQTALPAVTAPEAKPPAQTAPSVSEPPSDISEEYQNSNLRSLFIDTTQGQSEIKNSIQKFANEFASSAAEHDLVEVKILDKDKQPIGKKDFFSGFGLTIPDPVSMKLSEEYSIFVKKEQGAAKLGLVFRTVTSSGLADEMKNWEPTMIPNLRSLYLSPVISDVSGSFSSSRYMNADIRYFNFPSPADTSLDYSVISNFLIIGTSKDTTRAVLDYMAEK